MPGTNTRQPLPRPSFAPGRLADACERHGVTLPDAAIAFPLLHPAVSSVTLGMRSAEQVRVNVERYQRHVPDELWADLVAEDLIDAAAGSPR